MTLRLPLVEAHASVQQALDQITSQFPLKSQNLTNGVVGAAQLATGIVLQLASTGTARKLAFGGGSCSFSGSGVGSTVTITHGLGTTPQRVVVTPSGSAPAPAVALTVLNYTATTFDVSGRASGVITFTQPFDWFAVG